MFIVLLRFSDNKARAGQFMQAHKEWIERGFSDGIFLLVGSLRPDAGGAILAHGISLAELESRVREDPFVEGGIVSAEILGIDPARVDERLGFLLA